GVQQNCRPKRGKSLSICNHLTGLVKPSGRLDGQQLVLGGVHLDGQILVLDLGGVGVDLQPDGALLMARGGAVGEAGDLVPVDGAVLHRPDGGVAVPASQRRAIEDGVQPGGQRGKAAVVAAGGSCVVAAGGSRVRGGAAAGSGVAAGARAAGARASGAAGRTARALAAFPSRRRERGASGAAVSIVAARPLGGSRFGVVAATATGQQKT